MKKLQLLLAATIVLHIAGLDARPQQEQAVIIGGAAGPATPATGTMAFEVASVKPNKSGTPNVQIGVQPGGRFTATNVPLRQLIIFAYQLQNFQLIDAPEWTRNERFDILAKAEGDVPATPLGTVGPIQLMMRSLLAERFGLKVHNETRELPIYELRLAREDGKLGAQMQPSTVDCAAQRGGARRGGGPPAPPAPGERPTCGMFGGFGTIRAGGIELSLLARNLAGVVGRVIIDRTGLTGRFDFDLTFTPDQFTQIAPPPPGVPQPPPADPNGPSLFTALQEQLGLKLEPARGPVEVLVVDSVSQPTPD